MQHIKKNFFSKNVITAVLLILLAAYMILSGLGLFTFNLYLVIMTLLFVVIAVRTAIDFSFSGLLFALAHILVLYRTYLNIPETLGSWIIILAGTLLGIALDLLFKEAKGKRGKKNNYGPFVSIVTDDGTSDDVSGNYENAGQSSHVSNMFSGKTKYLNVDLGGTFEFENCFGELVLYLSGNPSVDTIINLNNRFGETQAYIPKDWDLILTDSGAFGEVSVHGEASLTENSPKIQINASNAFGEISIFYS